MAEPGGDVQARVDRLILDLLGELESDEAVYTASVLLNRVAVEVHKRVRAATNERRGAEDWGTWAGLQNVARNLVLQSSTCRDNAAALTGRKR